MKNFTSFVIYSVVFFCISSSIILLPALIFDLFLDIELGPQKNWLMIASAGVLVISGFVVMDRRYPKRFDFRQLGNVLFKPLSKSGAVIWLWISVTMGAKIYLVDVIARRFFDMNFDMMGIDTFLTVVVIFYGAALFVKSMSFEHNGAVGRSTESGGNAN